MKIGILPAPKEIIAIEGEFRIPIGTEGDQTCVLMSDEQARVPADLIAKRFKLELVCRQQAEGAHIRVNLVKNLEFTKNLPHDRRVEAYCLEISPNGINISALTSEGLLRGAATLFQMTRIENGMATVPNAVINDWPNFRYRCASNWLVNVEHSRWAYDRGDGREAFLRRIKRKLDFCFEHKINMVWFDGFGWNTDRFPGYATLMEECTRYARRLGIKLVFGGYGGGYGTAYQTGEIYRCGYFGKVYLNSLPYPDGKEYDCCGLPGHNAESRRYGTCSSNEFLRAAKMEEMKQFVSEVKPGVMYIHDIDAGSWQAASEAWKQRCGECRRRWPNDEMHAADGQAGAYASWFRQVRQELNALPGSGDYSPAKDLTLVFTSPLYTHYEEKGPENLWELEMRYFESLSRLIGPVQGIEFGLREQFYCNNNRKKINSLRTVLDKVGNGHGIYVLSFGGGDNYISDDLTNTSGAMAHFFDGAESVCLFNSGMHGEPVQMLNSDFLWSGTAGGYCENPADKTEAEAIFKKIASGAHKTSAIFAADGTFDRMCIRLWGEEAGQLMSLALQAKHNGLLPVSHVWWSITTAVFALGKDEICSLFNWERVWENREQATVMALKYARKAAKNSDNEDVRWFVKCLEIGMQFSKAVKLLCLLKSGRNKTGGVRLAQAIDDLEEHLRENNTIEKTDILGGDPGCWQETAEEIKRLAESFTERQESGSFIYDFIVDWRISKAMPSAGSLDNIAYPKNKESLQFSRRIFPAAFCDLHDELFSCAPDDVLVYFVNSFNCAESTNLELLLGYDGPVNAWIDGGQIFHDPNGTNPARPDAAVVSLKAEKGDHELIVALGSNCGKACGIFARFAAVMAK
jgi:hypothetical protein